MWGYLDVAAESPIGKYAYLYVSPPRPSCHRYGACTAPLLNVPELKKSPIGMKIEPLLGSRDRVATTGKL